MNTPSPRDVAAAEKYLRSLKVDRSALTDEQWQIVQHTARVRRRTQWINVFNAAVGLAMLTMVFFYGWPRIDLLLSSFAPTSTSVFVDGEKVATVGQDAEARRLFTRTCLQLGFLLGAFFTAAVFHVASGLLSLLFYPSREFRNLLKTLGRESSSSGDE